MSDSWPGRLVNRLPADRSWVKLLKAAAKSVLTRRRVIKGRHVVFEGIEDAVLKTFYSPGPGMGEVMVKTVYSAVSPGTERGYYLNEPNFFQPRPCYPGYSGCGIVKKAAGKSAGFQKGDIVSGILKHSGLNINGVDSVVRLPKGVGKQEAAFVTLGVIALCGVRAVGRINGKTIGVLGQGILGQMINQMVRFAGASRIVAIALSDHKKSMAVKSGVDDFLALDNENRVRSDNAFDVVIDCAGSLRGFETALEMVRPKGRVVMLGSIPEYTKKSDWAGLVVEKGIEVRGAHIANLKAAGLTYRQEATRFLNSLAGKKLKLDHLITDVYKPEDSPEIYRRLARGDRDMVGVLIDWQRV